MLSNETDSLVHIHHWRAHFSVTPSCSPLVCAFQCDSLLFSPSGRISVWPTAIHPWRAHFSVTHWYSPLAPGHISVLLTGIHPCRAHFSVTGWYSPLAGAFNMCEYESYSQTPSNLIDLTRACVLRLWNLEFTKKNRSFNSRCSPLRGSSTKAT